MTFGLALLIAVLSVVGRVYAQKAPTKLERSNISVEDTDRGQSIVTGHAIFEDTQQPATRERVQLIPGKFLANPRGRLSIPTAITDEAGEFSLKGIAAGEYYVVAQPMHEHVNSGELFPFLDLTGDDAVDSAKLERFKREYMKILVDGRRSVEVSLRVRNPHFGTVSGRVFDVDGNPAARAKVHLLSPDGSFGIAANTDEQGQYRLWGLPAGEYMISASPPPKPRGDGETSKGYEGLLGVTYFPSTLDARISPSVTVIADRDTGNIEITLVARRLHSIAGTVRTRGDGRPVTNATLRLSKTHGMDQSLESDGSAIVEGSTSPYISPTDAHGNWSFFNLPDGTYKLFVQPRADQMQQGDSRFVQQEQTITIAGSDVEDQVIEVSQGGRISGVVTIEGKSLPLSILISANKGNAHSAVTVSDDRQFTLTGVPDGEVTLSAFSRPEDRFYVKSIEANGVDLLRENLKLDEGAELKGVQIVISAKVGVVTGRVISRGRGSVSGIKVQLCRMNPDKLRLFGGKLAVTDDLGNFSLSAAPGEYLVVAWHSSEGPSAYADALTKAPRVRLLPEDRLKLDLQVP